MKKQNEQPIKQVLRQMMEQYHLNEKVNEVKLVNNWEKLMGKTIAKYTQEIYVNKKKLFIRVQSAPLKQELSYSRERIIELVNEEIGEGYINEVVIR
ncbi:MAG: DUF721 domain-containing protein [Phycisphaeraceae bacterium]|nr:DUF721 domain-containing protein [Phycisphaeraceae bacterium]